MTMRAFQDTDAATIRPRTPKSQAVGPGIAHAAQSYIITIEQEPKARGQRRPKSAGQAPSGTGTSSTAARRPRTRNARRRLAPTQVNDRLVLHGLPAEVERCRELAVSAIPAEARPGLKYTTNGGEGYVAGSLEVTTANEPAFNAFNRLVAQVPAVTVTLEYDDLKTATRRLLRAVDAGEPEMFLDDLRDLQEQTESAVEAMAAVMAAVEENDQD